MEVANGRATRVTVTPPGGAALALDRSEPFAPSASALAEFAGTYRSEEIEIPYRIVVRDGTLRLQRLKATEATLTPLVTDTFTGPVGAVRFTRDAAGRVTGLMLDTGRIRNMRFSKTP